MALQSQLILVEAFAVKVVFSMLLVIIHEDGAPNYGLKSEFLDSPAQ